MSTPLIRVPEEADRAGWKALRQELWPEVTAAEHGHEMALLIENVEREVALVAVEEGEVVGFVEASLRDVAEGTTTSPVGYLEGWYVTPAARGRGIGRRLAAASERWAGERGALEMASDARLDNDGSHRAHRALGYRETDRLVHFLKPLAEPEEAP